MGIRYDVIRVYPLFREQSQKRSKFSDLTEERLAVRILRVNGLNTNRSAIKVV